MRRSATPQIEYICGTPKGATKDRHASRNAHIGGDNSTAARGFRAALAAGRRPVDFAEYGPVDRAVFAEIGRYQTQPRKSVADRARLRAALIPFFHLSGVAS